MIDREALVAFSNKAARSNERACISLLVATMMWGSGMTNGRGPWRTAGALADRHLGEILVFAHKEARSGEIKRAFMGAGWIPGCAEGYFTKWMWAVSLGLPPMDLQPLILDARTREGFEVVLRDAGHDDYEVGGGYQDYIDYVTVLHDAAKVLRKEHGIRGATGEKLEWLMSVTRGVLTE